MPIYDFFVLFELDFDGTPTDPNTRLLFKNIIVK